MTCDHRTTVCDDCRCRAGFREDGSCYCPFFQGDDKPCCEGTGVVVIGLPNRVYPPADQP